MRGEAIVARVTVVLAVAVVGAACGGDDGGVDPGDSGADAGVADAGGSDASETDASEGEDAGSDEDAGAGEDAGPGEDDAGPDEDAGAMDAGAVDAGAVDAGGMDAGPVDAGYGDAGPLGDAGPCTPPGSQICYRGRLLECTTAGYTLVEDCRLGCTSTSGSARCRMVEASHVMDRTALFRGSAPIDVAAGESVVLDTDTGEIYEASTGTTIRSAGTGGDSSGIVWRVQRQGGGYPELSIFATSRLTIEDGGRLTAQGARSLVLLSIEAVRIDGALDVGGVGSSGGPGGGGGAGGTLFLEAPDIVVEGGVVANGGGGGGADTSDTTDGLDGARGRDDTTRASGGGSAGAGAGDGGGGGAGGTVAGQDGADGIGGGGGGGAAGRLRLVTLPSGPTLTGDTSPTHTGARTSGIIASF